jgi:hypothetical protein
MLAKKTVRVSEPVRRARREVKPLAARATRATPRDRTDVDGAPVS